MGTRFWARFFLSFTSSLYYFNYEQIKGHEKSKRQSIRFTYIFSHPSLFKIDKKRRLFRFKKRRGFFQEASPFQSG